MIKKYNAKNLLIILVLLFSACQLQNNTIIEKIKINNQIINAEVVDILEKIQKGLSGRKNLCQNCGMLFKYSDYQTRYFWMKEMNFPLDIIWIKDDKIVGIEANVPFLTNGQISEVQSKEEVNRVLELNGGWAESHNVKIGDKIGLD